MTTYYVGMYDEGNVEAFRYLLFRDISDYDENFILQEHIDSIVEYDRKYTLLLNRLLADIGYYIKLDTPYIAGIGSTSIAYIIYKRKSGRGRISSEKYIAKFIWGGSGGGGGGGGSGGGSGSSGGDGSGGDGSEIEDSYNYNLYETDVRGQQLLKSILPIYTLDYYYYHYYGDFGLIIMDYIEGVTLDRAELVANREQLRQILTALKFIRGTLLLHNVQHTDLRAENIIVNLRHYPVTVKLIDYAEVRSIIVPGETNNTEYIDNEISQLKSYIVANT